MKNIKIIVESILSAIVGFGLTEWICRLIGVTGLSAFNLAEGVAGLLGIGTYLFAWLYLLRRTESSMDGCIEQ